MMPEAFHPGHPSHLYRCPARPKRWGLFARGHKWKNIDTFVTVWGTFGRNSRYDRVCVVCWKSEGGLQLEYQEQQFAERERLRREMESRAKETP